MLFALHFISVAMRILQVITSVDPKGGGPIEGLIQQGIQMSMHGHDVQTLTLDSPGSPVDARLRSSAVYFLGPRYLGYAFAPRLEPWLREHASKFDVIIIHGMWQYHGYCVAKVARSLGVPYVIFLHGMLDPWFSEEYPLKHLKKWAYWPWAEYRVLRDARYVLFTTAEELKLARESFWLYKVRERLVGYGIGARTTPIGSARETFLSAYPMLRGKRILLFLSRIHHKKGCDLLVKAFAKVAVRDPSLHLVIAGPDQSNLIPELKSIAREAGVEDRISFPGMLSGDIKWGAYDASDAFVLTTHQENFGIVLAEALASRLPVLTTDKVNIWREILDGGGGLIQSDTQEGSDRLLEDWLNLSDADRQKMRDDALRCFEDNFEIGKVTGNLLTALKDAATEAVTKFTFKGRLFGSGVSR